MRSLILATVFAVCAAAGAPAQQDSTPAPRTRIIAAVPVTGAIHVDGVLDEETWTRALPAIDFVQAEPHEGEPASEATEVRVAFDATTLYVGATLHDRDPRHIVVNDIRKDFDETNEDDFEVILDTFGDRRNGYIFITNPEGARADRQVANEGREVNTSWDAPWTVRTRRTADGWTAEMAIPLHALRFVLRADRPWRVNFSRRIRRRNEIDFWAPVPRSYSIARLSLAGELDGLAAVHAGRDLRIKPYVAGRTVRPTGGAGFAQSGDVGADVKYGLTPGLTLDGTVNPDFAQVEADVQQVNLTQFPLYYPEKREFFLENSGIFFVGDALRDNRTTSSPDPDMILFFSRRIGLTADGTPIPINGGARLTGHTGGLSIGALSVLTRRSDTTPPNAFAVVRLRQNLFAGSDVGLIAMTRQSTDNGRDYNRVAGVDANIRFFKRVDWSSYAVFSRTPGIDSGQYTWRTAVTAESDFYHGKFGVLSVGDGFNDELGFYNRTGVRKWFMDTGIRPRLASLQQHGVLEMHPHLVWDYYTDQDGRMLARHFHNGYTFFLNDGGYVELSFNPYFERTTDAFEIAPGDTIPAGSYDWHTWRLSGSTDPSRLVSLFFEGVTGGLWSGRQRTLNAGLTVQPSFRFHASLEMDRTDARLEVPAGVHFVETLLTMRAGYSFATNVFLDALSQYDPGTREFNANVRFNVIHHPLSDLYLVYNEQRVATPDHLRPGRSVIVKVTQMVAF